MSLLVLGLSHKTAPIATREAWAVPADILGTTCRRLTDDPDVSEAMIVSTCNRVEIYAVPRDGVTAELRPRLARMLGGDRGLSPGTFDAHGYHLTGEAAIRHVMRVCASLDSLVVGEAQILGQVKEAAAAARAAGTIGPILDRTLQAAFRAAKAVRTDTGVARATVSIGSVAVDLAHRIFANLEEVRVLVLGAGKMGALTAKGLADAGVRRVYVTNRTYERALALAERHGWHARAYDELDDLLSTVDVVISCTGASRPILDAKRMAPIVRRRKYRPLFVVDIAVPRDVDELVGDFDTVYLYNIDDLEQISAENLEKRRAEAAAAEVIVNAAADTLSRWHEALRVTPTLAAIRASVHQVAEAELERAFAKRLKGLGDADRAAVQAATRAMLNKVLHPAMTAIRDSAAAGDGIELAAAARRIFGVDGDPS